MNPIRMFWGLVLGSIGFLLLGIELGWLESSVLLNLLSFWPVILIVIGLSFIVKDKVVLTILILAIMALVGFLAINGKNTIIRNKFSENDKSINSQNINEGLNNSKKANINLNFGAAKIDLSAIEGSDGNTTLARINGQNLWNLSSNRLDKNGETTLTVSEDTEHSFRFGQMNTERKVGVNLTPAVPLNIIVNTGASTANIDLSKLKVENFEFNSGANTGEITFGSLVSLVNGKVKTGASTITIRIPKNSGLRVNYDKNALNNQNFANGLSLNQIGNNQYETNGYNEAANKINLEISAGVSNIKIVQY